jgi:hypothetical protein
MTRPRGPSGRPRAPLAGREDVETPAGKFKAIPVTSEITTATGKTKTTAWFALGVGIVKTDLVTRGANAGQVLKSFTPGK